MVANRYDAILVVSFGGPEGPDDVMPFLENVLRGRNVPRERMLEVAEHYQHFSGVSPINGQNRELIRALRLELDAHDIDLPIYWGNRNWHPLLPDTIARMKADGIRRAIAYFTSAFSSYSGCRQYRENVVAAQEQTGEGAPEVDKLRVFFNHPTFIEVNAANVRSAILQLPASEREGAHLLFTAHSIPKSMADNCRYEMQLRAACQLVAEAAGHPQHKLLYQSRSGPPTQPWLEPDICDTLEAIAEEKSSRCVVVSPIGFVSDHMEVLFDLDIEASDLCREKGLHMVRAATVGNDPRFIAMIRELIEERMTDSPQRRALGDLGPSHDVCAVDCCTYAPQRPSSAGRPG
jgi:ferrochelatase